MAGAPHTVTITEIAPNRKTALARDEGPEFIASGRGRLTVEQVAHRRPEAHLLSTLFSGSADAPSASERGVQKLRRPRARPLPARPCDQGGHAPTKRQRQRSRD